jgi:hypothetical protein
MLDAVDDAIRDARVRHPLDRAPLEERRPVQQQPEEKDQRAAAAAGAAAARVRRVLREAGRLRPRELDFLAELFFGCVCAAVETAGAGAAVATTPGAADAGSMADSAASPARAAEPAARRARERSSDIK